MPGRLSSCSNEASLMLIFSPDASADVFEELLLPVGERPVEDCPVAFRDAVALELLLAVDAVVDPCLVDAVFFADDAVDPKATEFLILSIFVCVNPFTWLKSSRLL